MRAWEFLNEDNQYRGLSLRHINKMKQDHRARQASFDRNDKLVSVMYSDPLRDIEIQKARMELEMQKAELAKAQAEASNETSEAISKMAAGGRERRKEDRQRVEDMAARALGRRKKTPPKPAR